MTHASEQRRFTQLNRTVLLVADLLSGKAHDRQSAAERLGIQPVAADRQLRAIEKLPGVKAIKEGRRRVFRFDTTAFTEAPPLAVLIGACFGASLAPLFEGTPYRKALNDARDRLLRQSRRRGNFQDVERKFVFLSQGGEISLPDKDANLEELLGALLDQHPVALVYEDFSGKVSTRRVEPLSLAVYKHQLYLMGRESDGGVRSFRFARIRTTEARGRAFKYPSKAEYDPEQVFAHSFGIFVNEARGVEKVELKLHPRWAAHVRSHRWHRSQRIRISDQEVRLSVDVALCPEVEAWVLSFGEEAEVLRPASLRKTIAERVGRLARLYAAP